ncbi:MAG: FHA domain-containing protein [Marinosulfonomonas sp.]|nr:FHA domain-containing protein [Marinosulfonomonas sp.]
MELDDDELWDEIDDLDDYDEPGEVEKQKTTVPSPIVPSPIAAQKPVVAEPSTSPAVARNISEIRSIPRPAMAEKAVTQPLPNASAASPEVFKNTAPVSQETNPATSERPTTQVKKIWDLEPGTAEGSHLRPVKDSQPTSTQPKAAQKIAEAPKPAEGRVPARAGRVKTRLLGFEHAQDSASDPFQTSGTTAKSTAINFPVGWMVVTKGPGRGNSFSLFNGVSQIGRGDDQAIRLDFGDNSISRSNHAAVAYDAEQRTFYLGHGGKANLVRLNDKPVLSTEELSNRDLIRIGETTLSFVAFCNDEFDWDLDNQDETNNAAIA